MRCSYSLQFAVQIPILQNPFYLNDGGEMWRSNDLIRSIQKCAMIDGKYSVKSERLCNSVGLRVF